MYFKYHVSSFDRRRFNCIFSRNVLEPNVKCSLTKAKGTDPESNRQSRPQKRLGGGGYGYFKNINDSSNKKKSQRIKIFKHVGKRKNIRQISK